jgi:PKD repeat protein
MTNKSYVLTNYSLGNPDDPTTTIELGGYHRYLNRPEPNTPLAIIPDTLAVSTPTLVASYFSGEDSLMTSQFQITGTSGDYSSPLVNIKRDWEDVYGNTGSPGYDAIDLNHGIDLQRLTISPLTLVVGNNYFWRVRYRDHNYRWSPWSEESTFTVVNSIDDKADFTANITSGAAPLKVYFTDLSVLDPTAWDWDFNGDMIIESNDKDPVYTFTEPGIYTVKLTSHFSGSNISEQKENYITVLPPDGIEDASSEQIICSPNPFNRIVHLTFDVPCTDNHVTIDIYDNIGKYITTVYDGECNKGKIKTQWDGKNSFGEKVDAGVYYCRITSMDIVKSVKLIYID